MNYQVQINTLTKPFVGLRPFETFESEVFFGREEQTQRLLNKLHDTNFVAVVGSSGSGKSSLVKAGLIPALKAGFLNKGDHWHIISLRPGDNPIYYLARSLKETFSLQATATDLEKAIQQEGTDVILNIIREHLDNTQSSALILIDQFEELFTHFNKTSGQAALMYRFEFVKMILELIQTKLPIYVILTMRSDFIGGCNVFRGLPEALSDSQFLVPTLQGNELVRVVEGPVKLFGCSLQPGLTQKILNDLKDDEDQLPVLQHCLSQLWNKRKSEVLLTEDDYKAIGKLKNALSNQANAIYRSLVQTQPRLQSIIKEMFQYIIDFDGEKKEGVRKPRKVKDIQKVTGATFEEIKSIYDAFSAEDACFLFSPSGKKLHEDSIIDISHESLMREWDLFKEWKNDEEKDKRRIERLNDFATEYHENSRELLRGIELKTYSGWKKYVDFKHHANREKIRHWALRYSVDFDKVYKYIKTSNRKELVRKALGWSLAFLVITLLAGFYLKDQQDKVARLEYEKKNALITTEALALRNKIDSLALVQQRQTNRELATQSSAQAALYKANSDNEQLRRQIKSLEQTISEKDRLLNSVESKRGGDARTELLTTQNQVLTNEKRTLEKQYAEALSTIETLRLQIASSQRAAPSSGSSYDDPRIKEGEWTYAGKGKGAGYGNSRDYYKVCLSIDAPPEEIKRMARVRYYLLHDSFGKGGADGKIFVEKTNAQSNFEHCITIWGTFPLRAEILYNDKQTKNIELQWRK